MNTCTNNYITTKQHLTASAVAGATSTFIDTVAVRLQTQGSLSPWRRLYKGPLDCLIKILRRESIKGLYRGVTMPMFTGTLQQAVMLGCNRLAQQWWNVPSTFTKDHPKSDRTLRDWVKLGLSGSFAGVISSLLVCPSDKVKIRLQIHEIRSLQYNWKQPRYYGPLQCVQDIVKRGGFVKGLYRGYSIVLMREAIYAFAYFPAYEASKSTLSRLVNGLNMRQGDGLTLSKFIEVAVSGGIAGCVGWSVILPIDCIKSRLQADRFPHQYAGVIDCFRKTVAQGGWRTLFAGWKPILLRAFPLHATVFATYESLKAYYQTINQKMLIL